MSQTTSPVAAEYARKCPSNEPENTTPGTAVTAADCAGRFWWISKANTLAALRGWSPFIGLQIEYSLIERTVERELIPMAKALNLGLVAWSPLAGGVLTGKYASGQEPDGRYSSDMMRAFLPEAGRQERIVKALRQISQETGGSLAQ